MFIKYKFLQQKFPEEDSENKNNNALILIYNPIFSNNPLSLRKNELQEYNTSHLSILNIWSFLFMEKTQYVINKNWLSMKKPPTF